MNFCEQLVDDAIKATSLEELSLLSTRADAMYLSEENTEIRELMTDDFWLEFTKVCRKKAWSIDHQQNK